MSGAPALHIHQGEYAVSGDPAVSISTVLGSCVAACLWDGEARVGGMNHILLPDMTDDPARQGCFGVHAMELLINAIVRAGGARSRLRAKLFGGAQMFDRLSGVGQRNAEFAQVFLEAEGIPLIAHSLGGSSGRRVEFWPVGGKARQKLLSEIGPETAPPVMIPDQSGSDIELF